MPPSPSRRRQRQGPCGNERCTDHDNPSGQWQFIPDDFNGRVRPGAICTCKKAVCLRYFGLKDQPGIPGRKRKADSERMLPGACASEGPPPPIFDTIDEVWGVRCACLPALSCTSTDPPVASRRRCNISTMHPHERGEPLEGPVIEYCIHGHFYLTENSTNGIYGAWWFTLRKLRKKWTRAQLMEHIEEFEAALAEERNNNFDAISAGDSSDDDVAAGAS